MTKRLPYLLVLLLCVAFLSKTDAAPNIQVTGIMLSTNGATAIINGKCYTVHDTVAGGEITAIKQGGITLQINDEIWEFPVSGKPEDKSRKTNAFTAFIERLKIRFAAFKKWARSLI